VDPLCPSQRLINHQPAIGQLTHQPPDLLAVPAQRRALQPRIGHQLKQPSDRSTHPERIDHLDWHGPTQTKRSTVCPRRNAGLVKMRVIG
jgi:hypothetical protein